MADLKSIGVLTDDEFEHFRSVVYDETGINMSDMKRALLQSRLVRRLRVLNLPDFASYRLYFDEHYDDELMHFINAVTTNKTDFTANKIHNLLLLQTLMHKYSHSTTSTSLTNDTIDNQSFKK